jgi:hypothetical protein
MSATSCSQCGRNEYSFDNSSSCVSCPAGYFSLQESFDEANCSASLFGAQLQALGNMVVTDSFAYFLVHSEVGFNYYSAEYACNSLIGSEYDSYLAEFPITVPQMVVDFLENVSYVWVGAKNKTNNGFISLLCCTVRLYCKRQ